MTMVPSESAIEKSETRAELRLLKRLIKFFDGMSPAQQRRNAEYLNHKYNGGRAFGVRSPEDIRE